MQNSPHWFRSFDNVKLVISKEMSWKREVLRLVNRAVVVSAVLQTVLSVSMGVSA